jgi:hypothetical protein
MTIRIDSAFADVLVMHRTGRGKEQPELIDVQIWKNSLWLWDEGCQIASEIYSFEKPRDSRLGYGISEMPHLDEIYRALAQHQMSQRGNLLAEHLGYAVRALETAIAERDGSSVYFAAAGDGGQIKIGWSKNVSARLTQLQTGSASPIKLLGTTPGGRAAERRLHGQFAHLRISGEWFKAAPELLDHIASLATVTPINSRRPA